MQEYITHTRQCAHHIITRKLDFSPWVFFTDGQIQTASDYLYRKYPARKILCFAQNGDDHACLVLSGELAGKYIILHDFASIRSLVQRSMRLESNLCPHHLRPSFPYHHGNTPACTEDQPA